MPTHACSNAQQPGPLTQVLHGMSTCVQIYLELCAPVHALGGMPTCACTNAHTRLQHEGAVGPVCEAACSALHTSTALIRAPQEEHRVCMPLQLRRPLQAQGLHALTKKRGGPFCIVYPIANTRVWWRRANTHTHTNAHTHTHSNQAEAVHYTWCAAAHPRVKGRRAHPLSTSTSSNPIHHITPPQAHALTNPSLHHSITPPQAHALNLKLTHSPTERPRGRVCTALLSPRLVNSYSTCFTAPAQQHALTATRAKPRTLHTLL